MSSVEKIAGELRALSAGVETAHGLVAAIDKQAQGVALRATAAGFLTVAAGVAQIRDAIGTVRAGLVGLAGSSGAAVAACAAASRQGTPEETIAGLASVRDAVEAARNAATAAIERVGETQQLVAAVLRGGDPGPLLSGLGVIREVLVLLTQRAGALTQLVEAASIEAGKLGAVGN
ncbi:DUF6244 family protein [Polymorphospora rubra]|uniref:DUF6244 family protein n=1 Tax=Polymorphospora rubra TaxID=338584 RepID=UPI0033EE9998